MLASKKVRDWWLGLLTAEYHPPGEKAKLGTVELPSSGDPVWPIAWLDTRSNRLLVRPCWEEIWSKVDFERHHYQRDGEESFASHRFVINGVTGIGKSCHGQHIIYQLLQQWNRARLASRDVSPGAASESPSPPANAAPPQPLHILYQTTDLYTGKVRAIYHLHAGTYVRDDGITEPILSVRRSEVMTPPFEELLKHPSTIFIADGSGQTESDTHTHQTTHTMRQDD